jgi:pimeloyl-ACP methyl ester carboxylesterase
MPEITLPQGTIHYRDTGGGPPVVFLHGLLVDGEVWRKVTPLLEGSARSIVPDLPLGSHRIALNADAELSPAHVAAMVGDLLEALDLEHVTLVGSDTGGAISQLVALDHGERFGRLVLTNCDCFDVFPPKEFVPMVRAARVPGALYAMMQPMRAARARRMPMAYGALAHELPDEVTGA